MTKSACPFVFIVLDGWGYSESTAHNAIVQAHTPNWDQWWQHYPHTLLECSGAAVGLPAGQMGNSEVGHMHLGAGRVIRQELSRIDQAIDNGEFAANAVLLQTLADVKSSGSRLHLCGLLSPGGVHSHENHLFALLDLCQQQQCTQISVHAILDGRDTPPRSAAESLQRLQEKIDAIEGAEISTVCGRYYAMDRDKRWDRTAKAYHAMVLGQADHHADSAQKALEMAYARDENDEFVLPTLITSSHAIAAGDCFIFMNFRADRARQLSLALTQTDFDHFERHTVPPLQHFVTLTEYLPELTDAIAYPPQRIENTLGDILAQHNYRQLRIAETEKYAHVTFFLNGGREAPFSNEQRILIPSPKVATYDLQPRMSADDVTQQIVDTINQDKADIIIANFANADMIGHTGNFDATVTAITCLDDCLGKIYTALQACNGEMLITADHGNAEKMFNEKSQQAHTAHTSQPVPLLYCGRRASFDNADASLTDVAPTILTLLDLPIPPEMTGRSLIKLA